VKLTTYLHLVKVKVTQYRAMKLKMMFGNISSLFQYIFMAWYLGKNRDKFT